MNKSAKVLLNYLVKGLMVVLPLSLSLYIIIVAVTTVDSWLNLNNILGVNPTTGESRNIPGLGLLLVLTIIFVTGVIVTNFITEPIVNWFHRWMNRLPLLNFIYGSIKDLTEAFVGDEKKFNEPVLVSVEEGMKKIGFITQKDLTKLGLPDQVAVYFPFSYSFAGQLYIVPSSKVEPLHMSAADAMKFVVSGGVSTVDERSQHQYETKSLQ